MLVVGVDIGTQGARAVAVDGQGRIAAQAQVPFAQLNSSDVPGHKEQEPRVWKDAVFEALRGITTQVDARRIAALALDGTSGTVLAATKRGEPLTPGIMYNDARSGEEARELQDLGGEVTARLGYQFNASYGLPKMLWIKRHQPRVYEAARLFLHQADYIAGLLTGQFQQTDWSNAMKTGYDLEKREWPAYIGKVLPLNMLPKVQAPGSVLGEVTGKAAAETGLHIGTKVIAGCSDGYASALASGAVGLGDFCTTIGTTLVIKGVTDKLILDPKGRVYCHLHPEGWYMPGGAANIGGRVLAEQYQGRFDELNQTVDALTPTGIIGYPLTGTGERFPFLHREAVGFRCGEGDERQLYAATLEGVAFAERLSYRVLEKLGCRIGERIYTAGGAVKSDPWSRVRASVLNRELLVPEVVEAAMGSALLAACGTLYPTVTEAARNMVRIVKTFAPERVKAERYDELYGRFEAELFRRGYLDKEDLA